MRRTVARLCSTSLDLLIAALARSESQITAIALVALWVMAALGGALIPTWVTGEFLGSIGKFMPQYWAIEALAKTMAAGNAWPKSEPNWLSWRA